MARTNTQASPVRTHEGGRASHTTVNEQLRRSVLSCLLWEKTFYESGEDIATRISNLADKCSPEFVAELARQARGEYRLRHAPLWLSLSLIKRGGKLAGQVVTDIVQRPDEIGELIAMYNHDGRRPLSAQMKIGLGNAFNKFNEYQFAKWDRKGGVTLRTALRLTHPKPKDDSQKELFKRILEGNLETPNTWETRLSGGENKCEVFTDLLKTNKLGYIALLMNLRNMVDAGVEQSLIAEKLMSGAENSKALPFRFVAAARACPQLESAIDDAMIAAGKDNSMVMGKTVILVDVSASMHERLSGKSTLNRLDAASALAVYARQTFSDCRVFSFSNAVVEVPTRRGMALIDAVKNSQLNRGTYLAGAMKAINEKVDYDRIIVVTDEQSHDGSGTPRAGSKAYLLNVASYENGVGYGQYIHINGWSDSAIRYIKEIEKEGINTER